MRNVFILVAFIFILISCQKNKNQGNNMVKEAFVFGSMNEGSGEILYLQKMSSTGYFTLDSTQIDSNNEFSFIINVPFPGFYALKNSGGNHIPVICYQNDTIKTVANYFSFKQYELTGSKEVEQTCLLNKQTQVFLDKLDSIAMVSNDSIDSPNYPSIKTELDNEYHQAYLALRNFSEEFLNQNKGSLVSLLALSNQLGQDFFVFHPKNDFNIFIETDSLLFDNFPKNEAVLSLHQQILSLRNQITSQTKSEQLQRINSPAPEIALPAPDGEQIKLSDYKGKIVLVDFWASWCPPCRRENPNLVKIYNQYADKGFMIFQVSLDKSADQWKKAIADDHLNWVHVSDLKYWDSEAAKLYGISSIPANFLLNKEGIIIAKNISVDILQEKLEEIFND
jgi:peroxiredoxin